MAGVLVAAAELGWRKLGYEPSVKDTPELWSLERTRVSGGEGRAVVLIGSSRFQIGLTLGELSKALGGVRVHQLAITGASSLPVLEDLAADERFRGLVLSEVTPTFTFSSGPTEAHQRPEQYVTQHRHRTFVSHAETVMRVWFQEHLVVLVSELHPKNVMRHLLVHRKLPPPPGNRYLPNREQHFDPTKVDVKWLRELWAKSYRTGHGKEAEPAELEALLERAASAVDRIRARGGDVIFVRMVSSGTVREIEDERYPRARYWDRLIARTGKGLSFEDVPELARFECPEDAHLDRTTAPEYTRLLGQALRPHVAGTVAAEVP